MRGDREEGELGRPRTEEIKIGRGERIRTSGLLVPNQALYQAEPRPEPFYFSTGSMRKELHSLNDR